MYESPTATEDEYMNNTEKILLLLSQQKFSDEQRLRLEALAKGVDWGVVCKLAKVHKIESLIYNNLRNNNLLSILPSNIESHLKAVYYQVSIRNSQFKELAEDISALCPDSKILLVKGSALIFDFYKDLGARYLADVDIMVPKADRDYVWEMLTSGNWNDDNWPGLKSKAHNVLNNTNYKTMHYLYYGKAENSQFVDIHWKFYVGCGADAVAEYAFNKAVCVKDNLYVHSNEMQVVHLCTNNYLDYREGGVMYLRNLCDINEFIKARPIDWSEVDSILQISGTQSVIREAVIHSLNIIESLYNTPIPSKYKENVFNGIEISPISLLQLPVTKLKKNALQSFIGNIKALGKPSLVCLYVFKEIFPDGRWLKGMYPDSHAPLLSYWSYMVRRHLLHKNIRYKG